MTSLGARIDAEIEASELRSSSTNDAVFGHLRGEHAFSIDFAPGYVARVARADLERHLADVLAGLFAQLEQSQLRRSARSGARPSRETHSLDHRRQAYLDRLEQLSARGESSGGAVVVTRIGWDRVTVDLSPEAFDGLDEPALAQSVAAAAEAMMADRRRQVLAAKREIYHPEMRSP